MNKRAYIFCLIVLIIGFSISYICGSKFGNRNSKTISNQIETETSKSKISGFWVKIKDGSVFVYQSDGQTVVSETGIDISQLSDQEIKILETGVYLETAQELFNFLESSTS